MIQRETSAFAIVRTDNPVRTCVGCRGRELAVNLLRVVATGTQNSDDNGDVAITVDTRRKLPGRGAWLHRSVECYHLAVRRRAFTRALRITGLPDTTLVIEYLTALDNQENGPRDRRQKQ